MQILGSGLLSLFLFTRGQQLYPIDGVTPAPKPVAPLMPVCTILPTSKRCYREYERCTRYGDDRPSSCLLNETEQRQIDTWNGRKWIYDPRGNSVRSCAAACWQRGWRYAAVQTTRCECGNKTLVNASRLLPLENCTGATAMTCIGNSSEKCGASSSGGPDGASFLYSFVCHTDPTCAMNGTTFWNGSIATFKQYIDCWYKADDLNAIGASFGRNLSQPGGIPAHTMVLCGMLRQQGLMAESEWWCDKASKALQFYADHGIKNTYHCYAITLGYHWLMNISKISPSPLSPAQNKRYIQLVQDGCGGNTGHSAKVQNHGIDAATQQAFALHVFPNLPVDKKLWMEIPNALMMNWLHAHALDENAINYDAISISQLLVLLQIMPGGLEDLRSEQFKRFAFEFADALGPGGMLANHGGGLQDDGQGYANGASAYIYLFEVAATQFQHSDPEAASYFKWASRQVWRNWNPVAEFSQFHFAPVFAWQEELKQLRAGGGTPIPLPANNDSMSANMQSKVVYKNEYQHDANHTNGGPVPKKLVVCASRKEGGGYVQQDIYNVPPGYHGDAMQAGTLSHYEYGQTLFVYGGMQTKHTSQSDADTGVPTMMPFSTGAERLYPWRWGQHNMKPGAWQRQESPVLWFSGAHQNTGNWQDFWPTDMTNLELVCISKQDTEFSVTLDRVTLIGPAGEKVVDDFAYWNTTPDAWGPRSSWSTDTVGAHSNPDRRSLKLVCSPHKMTTAVRPASATPELGYTFDGSQYTHLRFHYKVSGEFVVNQTYGWDAAAGAAHDDYGAATYLDIGVPLRLKPLYNVFAGTINTAPTNDYIPQFDQLTASANAQGDSHGGYRARAFGGFTADTEWTRHMVLLAEGTLVVLDSLVPTGLGNGSEWIVGTPWQLNFDSNCSGFQNLTECNLATVEAEGDWFDLSGFERTTSWHQRLTHTEPPELSLLVKLSGIGNTVGTSLGYMAPPELNYPTQPPGARHPSPWYTWPWQTIWSRQRVMEGDRGTFVSVFVPYDRHNTTARAIYANTTVTIGAANQSATVTLGAAGKRVYVDVHGKWEVTAASAGDRS